MRILIVWACCLRAPQPHCARAGRAGQAPPPWWVGGRLVWPFGLDTHTLVRGDALDTLTPLLGIASAVFFVLAAGSVLHWWCRPPWASGRGRRGRLLAGAAGGVDLALGRVAAARGRRAPVGGLAPQVSAASLRA